MKLKIPERYTPLLMAVCIIAGALLFYVGNSVFTEPDVDDCCATEWDPTPYQQVPARTLP